MNVVSTPTLVIVGCTPSRVARLTDFFRGLPKDMPWCVLLVDLSSEPDPSRLGNVAREHSAAAPCLLYDGAPLKKGEIYVAPLNRIARLEADTFRLVNDSDIELAPGHRLGIDPSSLGDDTVLAVLTPMRPELQRVFCHFKSEGALTLLHLEENDFSLSLHDLQPGCPDRAIRARSMGPEIQKWTALRRSDRASEAEWQSALQSCVDEVKQSTGEDFSDYRDSTLIQKIKHRLAIRNLTLESYVELLKKDRDEIQFLAEDWRIKVTRFFRDRDVFEALKSKVLPNLVRAGNGPLRVWIPGCATGEEAYSIAILILEDMRIKGFSRNVQIFATDVDSNSLNRARAGHYPASIGNEIPPDLLQRYFRKESNGYRIRPLVRELFLFSRHNLLSDSPFSRMDLISCRNLLIYLSREGQDKAMRSLAYSLKEGGTLMLGKSEDPGQSRKRFTSVFPGLSIFSRNPGPGSQMTQKVGSDPAQLTTTQALQSKNQELAQIATRALVRRFSPPAVLINERNEILYVQGSTGDFLELPAGQSTNELLSMARPEVRPALIQALNSARRLNQEVSHTEKTSAGTLQIVATPQEGESQPLVLITFLVLDLGKKTAPEAVTDPDSREEQGLRQEVHRTRVQLDNTILELQQANDELSAINESAELTNEELQSANEELIHSRYELQSLNEELQTTNQELQYRLEELSRANNDIINLIRSTEIPVIFLDQELCIRWFSPDMSRLMGLDQADIGLSVLQFHQPFPELDWEKAMDHTLQSHNVQESTLETEDDRFFALRILPYRTGDDVVEGAVFTFQDITEKQKQDSELAAYRHNLESIVKERSSDVERSRRLLEQTGQVARVGGWEIDAVSKKLEWTYATTDIFETAEDFVPDLESMMSFFHADDQDRLQDLISLSVSHGQPFDQELRLLTSQGNEKWIVFSGRPIIEHEECVRIFGSIQDITERKRFEERLKRTTNMLLRTEHVASLGSWEWNLETDQVTWSDELFNIFGLPAEEGPPAFSELSRIYTEESLQKLREAINRSIERKIPYFLELEAIRRDGKRIFGIASGLPIKDFSGRVTKFYGSFQDITVRALAEQEATRAREEAERANRAKTLFLGNLSHELRTPMNAIIGMTELALEESLNSEVRNYLETVRDASGHLMEIISDLLDSAVIEKGQLELSEELFSLRTTVQRANSVLSREFQEKGLPFSYSIDRDIPDSVIGDSRRLAQILINLLGNAVKYTSSGQVQLQLGLLSLDEEAESMELQIRVSDTGTGIHPENLDLIFDKFTQVSTGDNRLLKHSSGTGMGLYITRSIVSAMHGSINVESVPGEGSSFNVILPLRIRTTDSNIADANHKSRLPAMTILMAEDNAINALVQRTILEQVGHSVVSVNNGHEAIEALAGNDFDLILMDLEMPVLDGFQTTQAIRDGEAGKDKSNVPIVAITAHVLSDVEEHCIQSGMNGFITKPIDIKALGEDLARIMKGNATA